MDSMIGNSLLPTPTNYGPSPEEATSQLGRTQSTSAPPPKQVVQHSHSTSQDAGNMHPNPNVKVPQETLAGAFVDAECPQWPPVSSTEKAIPHSASAQAGWPSASSHTRWQNAVGNVVASLPPAGTDTTSEKRVGDEQSVKRQDTSRLVSRSASASAHTRWQSAVGNVVSSLPSGDEQAVRRQDTSRFGSRRSVSVTKKTSSSSAMVPLQLDSPAQPSHNSGLHESSQCRGQLSLPQGNFANKLFQAPQTVRMMGKNGQFGQVACETSPNAVVSPSTTNVQQVLQENIQEGIADSTASMINKTTTSSLKVPPRTYNPPIQKTSSSATVPSQTYNPPQVLLPHRNHSQVSGGTFPSGVVSPFPTNSQQVLQEKVLEGIATDQSGVSTVLEDCGGDTQLAQHELCFHEVPDLRQDAERWFDHFDVDNSGTLSQDEVVEALLRTLGPEVDIQWIYRNWPVWDIDGDGDIDRADFLSPKGLRDAVLESIPDLEEPEMFLHNKVKRLPKKGVLGLFFSINLDGIALRSNCEELLKRRYQDWHECSSTAFHVVVVPLEVQEAAFSKHWRRMALQREGWEALSWDSKQLCGQLVEKYHIKTLPSLVVIDKEHNIVTRHGIRDLQRDVFPWDTSCPAEGGVSSILETLDGTIGIRENNVLDEEDKERLALTLPLTEKSYNEVLRLESTHATRYFLRRVMKIKGMSVEDEDVSRMLAVVDLGLDMEATLRHGAERKPNDMDGGMVSISMSQSKDITSSVDQPIQPAKEPSGGGETGKEKEGDSGGEGVKGGKNGKDKGNVAQKAFEAKGQGGSVQQTQPAMVPSGESIAQTQEDSGGGGVKGTGKKGKGKGKGKKASGPSRTEKDNWVIKKKSGKVPKLRWKRRLEGDNLVKISESFAEEGEEHVKEDLLIKRFLMALDAEVKTRVTKVERKPLLWIGSEGKSCDKVRQKMAIVATKMYKSMREFIPMMQRGALSDIVSSPQFSHDVFVTLDEALGTISEEEWTRLQDEHSPQVYLWDCHVEGFFRQLTGKAKSMVAVIIAHFELLERTKDLSEQLKDAYEGICATTGSEELRRILRKILFIGNCFNAGDAAMCRADGFDCVDLLRGQLCIDMPRGGDNVSLLEHIRLHELSDQDVAAMRKLAEILRPWRKPDDDKDQTDLMEVQNDKAMLEKLLRRSQQILEGIDGDVVFLKPHWDLLNEIEKRLDFLRGGSALKGKGQGGLLELQRYFFHNPPREKAFAVGRILGHVAIFAKRCAGMV